MPNWNDVLRELADLQSTYSSQAQHASDIIRRKYLDQLHKKTGRNIIAYYSGFLSKPMLEGMELNDEDKNGFMMAVHRLKRDNGLDLIMHTPGGSIAATESIVNYLQKMFKCDIRAIIPQLAMSAGTMIACSCKVILMGEHSCLGPIDPQLRGIPAIGVIEEFETAYEEIKKDNRKSVVWAPIISQYRPTFLGQCQRAIEWSKMFVEEQLTNVMFKGRPQAKKMASATTKALLDYSKHKAHNRHIHAEDCRKMGLKIERLEDDQELQDIVLTVHHCYMHALMNSTAFKIIENHLGTAFVKQQIIPTQAR